MFIKFCNTMINTNYIISVYKTRGHSIGRDDKYFEVNLRLYPNCTIIKEIYNTKEEQETRFTELINILNAA